MDGAPAPEAALAFELTASQERLMSIIRDTDSNVFLTGDAGTGKTYVIDVAKRYLTSIRKRHETVAFTGAAAFNANGNTIHSALHPLPIIPPKTPDGHSSHYETAKHMLGTADVILMPAFETSQMVRVGQRVFNSQVARDMYTWGHALFRQRLWFKVQVTPDKAMAWIYEPGTSRTCDACGHVMPKNGSQVFR
jgi:PIF1-like helicase